MQIKDACDFCGEPIPPGDFHRGRAVVLLKKAYCRLCMKDTGRRSKAPDAQARPAAQEAGSLRGDSPPAAGQSSPGSHACLLSSHPKERRRRVLSFVQEGITKGEKVLYVADAPKVDHLEDEWRAAGLEVAPFRRSGQLEFLPASHVYAPAGTFDPEEMLGRIKVLREQVLREGYRGLRGIGEMTWALRGWMGSERLLDYERALDAVARTSGMTLLCQYDGSRFPPAFLEDVKRCHGAVLAGGEA